MIISDASAAQRVVLDCRFIESPVTESADTSSTFCAALAQYLSADLGLAVTLGDGSGHRIRVTVKTRSQYSMDITIVTAPLSGGPETSVKSVLSSHDNKVTAFSARTLVRPIATQLGVED